MSELFKTNIVRTEPWTKQEAFDRIWQFFAVEGHEKAYDGSICCYRTENSACAVGCLLPDELASHDDGTPLEGVIDDLYCPNPGLRDILPSSLMGFLKSAQITHDGWNGGDDIKPRLRTLAAGYNLTVPEAIS